MLCSYVYIFFYVLCIFPTSGCQVADKSDKDKWQDFQVSDRTSSNEGVQLKTINLVSIDLGKT